MNSSLPELSIFFPFWNEEKNINFVVEEALKIAPKVALKWEIIIVDDGSGDKTLEKAKILAKKHRNIKIITHSPNRGYGAALKAGFQAAVYSYIVFTDGDRQFDFSEITKFIKEIRTTDIVIGFRKGRKDNLIRHMLMNTLKVWDYLLFRLNFKDIDCGFKMFRKEEVDKIMPLRSEGAMITTEILAKAKAKKLKIKEVEVNHYPRSYGDQSGANIPVLLRAVLESFVLWWDLKNGRF